MFRARESKDWWVPPDEKFGLNAERCGWLEAAGERNEQCHRASQPVLWQPTARETARVHCRVSWRGGLAGKTAGRQVEQNMTV